MLVAAPLEQAEELRAAMLDACPEGFEEIERSGELEVAVYVDAQREMLLRESFPELRSEEVAPGWDQAWRSFHHGVRVGSLWVGPPWEEPEEGLTPIVIEPGQAFGTGAHATTRLSLELLLDQPPAPMLDIGCGSGVLGIAAAKLGFRPVVALDFEKAAVDATRENATANAVEVDVRLVDVLTGDLPEAVVAAANIDRRLVEHVAGRLEARFLIASGYLASETPELPGWQRRRRVERAGWVAELFERSASSNKTSG